MKKILLTAVAVFTAISVYGQYEYKINKRTGRFDMVVDTAWVRTNAGAAGPDSTKVDYGLTETANVISVDTSVIDFRARVDSLFENLTIGANTTTTATNFLMVENDSLHTMEAKNLSATTTADSVFVFENNAVKLQAANLAMIENDTADVDTLSLSSRINLKADYDSPTFTTAAYVPTAAATDSSTHAANTAWVKRHLRTRYEIDSLVISGSNIIAYEGGDTLSIYVPYANRISPVQYAAADTAGTTPAYIGQLFVDTRTGTTYIGNSTARGGWVILNYFFALCLIGRITRKDEV